MKNKNFARLLSLLLALIMASAVLAGCKKDEVPDDPATSGGDTTAAPSGDGAQTPTEGAWTAETEGAVDISEYLIIRPSELDAADTKAITQFRTYMKEYTGVDIAAKPDTTKEKDNVKEIVIGNTNRQASKDATAKLKASDWSVSMTDTKIIIAVGSEASIVSATNWIIENCLQKGNKYVKIGEGATYKHEYVVSDLKAGDTVVNSLTVGVLSKDNVGYVDAAILLADNLTLLSGVNASVATYGMKEGLNILVASPTHGREYIPDGVTLGEKQYLLAKDGDNIVIIASDAIGAEVGAQEILKAVLGANKQAVDLYSLCKNEAVDYTYGGDDALMVHGAEYRIMSFNVERYVLNQNTARYTHALNSILSYNPDVIGFQEFCVDYQANLAPKLIENGYTIVGNEVVTVADGETLEGTTAAASQKFSLEQNYTPIAYKTDKFTVVDKGWQRIIPVTPSEDTSVNPQGKYGWPGYTITWVVLEDKETGDTFAVTSLHNLTGSSEDNVAAKKVSLEKVTTLIKETIVAEYNCPVFSVGDYNSNETMDDYKQFAEGMSDTRYVALRGYSATSSHHGDNVVYGGGTTASAIDHIFVTGNAQVVRHRFGISMQSVPASDHYPTMVDVIIG